MKCVGAHGGIFAPDDEEKNSKIPFNFSNFKRKFFKIKLHHRPKLKAVLRPASGYRTVFSKK